MAFAKTFSLQFRIMTNKKTLQVEKPDNAPVQHRPRPTHRILLVDDDRDIRRFTAQSLVGSGFHVDAAEDGEVAWETLQLNSYDILITDNNMPKLTGIELVKKLRSARMALPVIMATGKLPVRDLAQNPSLQLAAILPKPFSFAELLGTVKEVLRASADAREQIAPPQNWQGQPLPNGLRL
jgi:DNA-binding response OmpR family regulator